jgi:putative FmdB family regulatory protein
MPHYAYVCNSCKHAFDVLQSMSAEPVKECPQCKGPVTRLISGGAGVMFKGSGFYDTDYKKKSGSASDKKSDPSCGCSGCHKQKSCPSSDTRS